MKISSVSKKVLASALSAAMVVAFAPTVAFGGVVSDGSSSAVEETTVSGDTVAAVTYYTSKAGKTTKNVQEFKATDTDSYDNALQAALAYANYVNTSDKVNALNGDNNTDTKTVVTLYKSVDVYAPAITGGFISQKDEQGRYVEETSAMKAGLFAGGTYTIDLNGNTITNAGENGNTILTIANRNFQNVIAGAEVSKTVTTFIDRATMAAAGDTYTATKGANETAQAKALIDAGITAATAAGAAVDPTSGKITDGFTAIAGAKTVTIPAPATTYANKAAAATAAANAIKAALGFAAATVAETEITDVDLADLNAGKPVTKSVAYTAASKTDIDVTKGALEAIVKTKVIAVDPKANTASFKSSSKMDLGNWAASTDTQDTGKVTDELTGLVYVQKPAGDTPSENFFKFTTDYSYTGEAINASTGAAGKITIVDSAEEKGAISASKVTAISAAGELVIDGATVKAVNAEQAINNGTKVVLKGGAVVTNEVKGWVEHGTGVGDEKTYNPGTVGDTGGNTAGAADINDIFAINNAGTVEIAKPGKSELKADEYAAYKLGATVKAVIAEAETVTGDKATATAVKATTFNAYRNAEVTAEATAAKDSSGAEASTDGSGTTGAVKPTTEKKSTATTAVNGKGVFEYGTYTADTAISGTTNTITYGTYNGYVAGANANSIYGGTFKYDPTEAHKNADGDVVQNILTLAAAKKTWNTNADNDNAPQANPVDVEGITYTSSKVGDMYAVYRLGTVSAESEGNIAAIGLNYDDFTHKLQISTPDGAVNAKGNEYKSDNAGTKAYLKAEYLDKKTKAEVEAGSEVGIAVNDGNRAMVEGALDVNFKASYLNPYSESDRAKDAAAFTAIDKQAAENIQHVNGVYKLVGQLTYDWEKDSKGTRSALKKANYGDELKSLGDVKLKYAYYPVAAGSDAKAYTIAADGTTAAIESKMQDAVAAGSMVHMFATTDALGTFGVTYSTAEDQKAQAEAKGEETVAEKATQSIEVAKKSMTVKVGSKKKTSKGKSFNIGATAETAVTASKKSGSSKITVTSAGKVKLAKGAVKGKTYTAKVSLKAAGSDAYLAAAKTITVKFTIKK